MNQRILELVEQAGWTEGYYESDDGPFIEPEFNKEKFAELIVQKFDDILVLEHLDCVGNKDKQAAERIDRLRLKVKTYFGVEE